MNNIPFEEIDVVSDRFLLASETLELALQCDRKDASVDVLQAQIGAHRQSDERQDVSRIRRSALNTNKAKVLMITTPGRRTGVLHSTCVRYLETPDGLLVWGTASGAPRDPDWFRNLRKAKVADVQIGTKTSRRGLASFLPTSGKQPGRTPCLLRLLK